ncbi:hypothetical protein HGRIS_014578 [Hohenbuehelia grisea]|uniref:Cytochrome P450 n=1 Tax=Hohenbuehelia grisea TaxID=104357 RepID=A0ABR3JUS4_9AGAR
MLQQLATSTAPYKIYREWAQTLGPIIELSPNNSGKVYMLGTLKVTLDLFDKRSLDFSSRPRFPMAELLGRHENVGFSYYNERLKSSRMLLSRSLSPHAVQQWEELVQNDVNALLLKMRHDPSQLWPSLQQAIQSFFMRLTYGEDPGPEYYRLIKTSQAYTGAALRPGRWLVNKYPILKLVPAWLPGASFQRWAREGKALYETLTHEPFLKVKERMSAGIAELSFVRNCLQLRHSGDVKCDERLALTTAGSILNAASETTSSAMLTLIHALAADERLQARAYEEIKTAVGAERLPSLNDRSQLPFINALLLEVLRFNPPIPILTHSNTKHTEYGGVTIPNASTVYANVWSILHDESHYQQPGAFIPERFLGDMPALDPRKVVFGVGRRACPGRHIAEALLFTYATRLIALFSVETDEKLEFDTEFNGLVSTPKPFPVNVIPRSSSSQLWDLVSR